MPNALMLRAKEEVARRGMTFKELVIDAVERALNERPRAFTLRDASAGCQPTQAEAVTADQVNCAIDALREPDMPH